ncbi:DAN Replication protein [Phytophthora megakarya]|uniref:DAN Replication protein n=1 Tax=Phytophthora megakarya TaxID=4795 RepID=A0A225X4W9_9STRA|nr:DAN Replication protein [Phytophthora megakarya]
METPNVVTNVPRDKPSLLKAGKGANFKDLGTKSTSGLIEQVEEYVTEETKSGCRKRANDSDEEQDEDATIDVRAAEGLLGLPGYVDKKLPRLGQDKIQEKVSGVSDNANSPGAPDTCYFVKDLVPDMKASWNFVGRVFSKTPVVKYKRWHKSGKLFSIWITGKATCLAGGVDEFYDTVTPGTICSFSGGRIKHVNRAFVPHGCAVEFSFGEGANIHEVDQETESFSEPSFVTATVASLLSDVGPRKTIKTRSGKDTDRREFILVDDTDTEVLCTSWGQMARDIEPAAQGTVLLLQDGKISDYMGTRSVNIGAGASLHFGTALTRSCELTVWLTGISPDHEFGSINGV